jgi:hypothetical protein
MYQIIQKNKKTVIKENNDTERIKIETKKYNIYLKKNKYNNALTISFSYNNQNVTHKHKFTDFASIDHYFNKFKGNIPLLCKYLETIFISNLFSINNNNNDDNVTITLFCLLENNNKFINLILPKISTKNKNNYNNNINKNDEFIGDNSDKINLGDAPPSCMADIFIRPNYFYFKTKNKLHEYNIYLDKNEYKEKNYKEIIFKIIEKERDNENTKEYYAYLNLVDFFYLSESYFSLFDYSIEDIYNDLLIIFSNWNYKIEKNKDKLKIFLIVYNT